ncbi:MAG: hypothetical protein MI922_09500, partial [Bacteroidales bacterium]|nr:hypothetical protein [Bacteroidales bacterium]
GKFTIWAENNHNNWKYDGVQVDTINVNIDKGSSFKIKGGVYFARGDKTYGNGFRGEVQAIFAGFELDAVAIFGNVNGYRYFYTDALVSFPKGIPAGPIGLYGFGGGCYYHMRQSIGNEVTSDFGRSTSGAVYIPDKSTLLGLKASVKFGLSVSEKAVNGEVEFGISFTEHGGVGQITLNGSAYFMTNSFGVSKEGIMKAAKSIMDKSGNTPQGVPPKKDAAIYGNISMLFDFPKKTFHSTFNIYLNVAGGVIAGVGDGGLAGWGVMHFEPGDWYVHIGTPDNPNGIQVMGMAEMTNYFMVGKSIPEMGDPPPQVLQGLAAGGLEYQGVTEKTALGDGSGFAMGAAFSFDTGEQQFLVFYGRFGLGLGFDIMLKNYGNQTCANFGENQIGIDGWYASGRAYAWVIAQIGIKVSLPFYSGQYTILDMQAAALLEAKAPNPFWMRGMVGGYYNILNGLVEGQCNFEFEVGEQCVVKTGTPFDNMDVIADITPFNDQNDVSVFTTPQVMFNLPVGKTIKFKDEYGNVKRYRVKMETFKFGATNGQNINGEIKWNSRKDVAVIKSKDILPGKQSLTVLVELGFEEYKNGGWRYLEEDGVIKSEMKTATFTTGKEPDHVPQENVASSYPGYRAFNYYKNESNGNFIDLKLGQPGLFNPGAEWVQKARLRPVNGGNAIYTTYSYDDANTQINLSIPGNIDNNTIYMLELVNIPKNKAAALDANVKIQSETSNFDADESGSNMTVNTQTASEARDELSEKVIYALPFRSSKYNTLQAKLNGMDCSDGILWELYPLVHSMTVRMSGERFDQYEVKNLQSGTAINCKLDLDNTLWYQTYIKPYVNLTDAELKAISGERFDPPFRATYIFQNLGVSTRNLTNTEIETGVTDDTDVVSGMKNYIAKYSCEYLYTLQGKAANTYINNPNRSAGIQKLLGAKFTPLKYGNYPVKVSYTLPNAQKHNSQTTYIIPLKN